MGLLHEGEHDMDKIFWQEEIEKKYNRKHIDGYIREAIANSPEMQLKVEQGIHLLEEYRGKTYGYDSKNRRVAQLENLDLETLVRDIFVGVAYCLRETLFTSVTSQMAGRLKFSDKVEAITTVAEIMAVLCMTDAFDIVKADKMASLAVISRIPLNAELVQFIEQSQYLPPMICEPKTLRSNYDSGYLTHSDSLVLGSGNHHDGDLCLDVLNLMNRVPLKLATDFLGSVEEAPTFLVETPEQAEQWEAFKRQSYAFYGLMARHGNRFHLTHKVDKRGRIYAQGYHVSTQGTAFKKAMVELADEEIVEGVPDECRQ